MSLAEGAATIVAIGFGTVMLELFQGGDGIEPADAEEVGTSLIEAMNEARVSFIVALTDCGLDPAGLGG